MPGNTEENVDVSNEASEPSWQVLCIITLFFVTEVGQDNMNVRVVYNKEESSIRVEPGWTVMKLMTKIQVIPSIPIENN